jgi:hypothetical protein
VTTTRPERQLHVPVEIPGGGTRPSLPVDTPQYPAVTRRRELLDRLLLRDCGNDGDGPPPVAVTADDLDLLDRISRERFGGARGELLRQRAVSALAGIDSPRAVARLVSLALNPVETDGIRLAALSGLSRARLRALAPRLAADASPAVRWYARNVTAAPAPRVADREPPLCPHSG